MPVPEMGLDNLRNIVNRNVSVENALRLDNGNGTLLAETMAAGKIHLNPIHPHLHHRFLQRFPDFNCLARNTPRSLADKDGALVV